MQISDRSPSVMISVEVAFALPDRQFLTQLRIPATATVRMAIADSGVLGCFPDIEPERMRVGIFGKPCDMDAPLSEGDRVEIYRPLCADAKERRRARATSVRKGRRKAG